MPTEPKSIPRAKHRRKKLRRGLTAVVLIVAAAAGSLVYRHYTDPERIRAMAETWLQDWVHGLGTVSVGSADFSWGRGVRLFDLHVSEIAPALLVGPASSRSGDRLEAGPTGKTVFSCREAHIALNPLSALLGTTDVKSIVAVEPTCSIVRKAAEGTTNLAALLRAIAAARSSDGPLSLPTIELRNARVNVIVRDHGQDRLVGQLTLTLRGRQVDDDARLYDVSWEGGARKRARGRSQIDLATGAIRDVDGGLPWMSIEAVLIALNAGDDRAGALLDLFGVKGAVRAIEYNLGGLGDAQPRWAKIELRDAAFSIPINELERALPPADRYLRFNQVNGWIRLTAGEAHSAEFHGLFHGSECHVVARIRGGTEELLTLDDLGFEVFISARGLELPQRDAAGSPAQERFIRRWPKLGKFYDNYAPTGYVDIELSARKEAGADETIAVARALLTARGAGASCRWFPYRLETLSGVVEYTPDGVAIRALSGIHDGGAVRIDGRLSAPNRCAEARIHIRGTTVAIDDALYNGCPEQYGKIRDLLDPQGEIDVDLVLTRPACTDDQPGKWRSKGTVSFNDLTARYAGFPYPVEHLAGELAIDGRRLRAVNVQGRSGQARIQVNGNCTLSPGAAEKLDVRVRGTEVPFDDRLMAALPAKLKEQVAAFHPSGRFNVETSITLDWVGGPLMYDAKITLLDVAARHDALPVTVTDIEGTIHVNSERIGVYPVAGRYNDATISAFGHVDHTGGTREMALSIRCADLELDDTLRASLPSDLRDALAGWRIDGPIDTETVLRRDPAGGSDTLTSETTVRLDGVTAWHTAFPLPFEGVHGEITFDADGVRATGIEARYGPARVEAGFATEITDRGQEGTVNVVAKGLVLDDAVRDLLPARLRALWNRLAPTGAIDVRLAPLSYRPAGSGDTRVWSVEGQLDLHDVALRNILDVSAVRGTLTTVGSLLDRKGGTSLRGQLSLSTLNLLRRRLTNATGTWSHVRTADGRGRFTIDPVEGSIYDGHLAGSAELMFGAEPTTYNLSTTITGMQIEPFLNAGRSPLRGDEEPVHARGLADARLDVYGEIASPQSRRGRGQVEIREAHMYRLPILVRILSALKLSAPKQDAFDEAEAGFLIVGDRVDLKDILLRGSVLALAGHGSMSLPDRGVDLHLAYSNPHGWPAVPLVDDLVKELVPLHVTGPLSQPRVRLRPLRGLQDEFKRLFQKRKPKKVRPATP